MGRRQRGFSLIELLIVVAIILIITAIAVPSYLRAKMAANEASAVNSVHAISTSEIGYSSTFPDIGFSAALSDLGYGGTMPCAGGPNAGCFLDDSLASGDKAGYHFTYVQDTSYTPSLAFTLNADPHVRSLTGQLSYYLDQNNVIRFNSSATASVTDPAL